MSALEGARELFPITATRAYLFAGALAPAATPVRDAIAAWVERWGSDPLHHRADYFVDWRRLRERFADVIGADTTEIAITDSTSRGANVVLQTIRPEPGANVVVDDTTYPSALYPFFLRTNEGIEVRRISGEAGVPRVEELADAVDGRTAAVSISHVCRLTGFRHDLRAVAEIAHGAGALLLVDAAQSAGAVEIDVRAEGVDALYCGAMKWLLGPPGVGFLFVRHGLVEELEPPQVGPVGTDWDSAANALAFREGARRHELGVANLPGASGALAGLEILLDYGLEAIEAHVLRLTGLVIDGLVERGFTVLTPPEPERRAGVVSFVETAPEALAAFLRRRGVDVWGYGDQARMRADPHLYNDDEDIERLLDGIGAFGEAGRA